MHYAPLGNSLMGSDCPHENANDIAPYLPDAEKI
jgi:hypothetical protein